MIRRSHALLLTIGLLAPVAVHVTPAGAIDQDLQVSANSGAPGDRIDVSSASCVASDQNSASLFVKLLSGTAPDQVLAGVAGSGDTSPATLVVPDWLDPGDPAVIEASCIDYAQDDPTPVAFDPVPFDVTPGVDPSVQAAALDRSSLLVGQGFTTTVAGCTGPDWPYAATVVFPAEDGDFLSTIAGGTGQVVSGGAEVLTLLAGGGLGVGGSGDGQGHEQIDEVEEFPTDIEPGSYTVVPYCADGAGQIVILPSQPLEVTGRAPMQSLDLMAIPGSRSITLAGTECTAGLVDVLFEAESTTQFFDGFDGLAKEGDSPSLAVPEGWRTPPRRQVSGRSLAIAGPAPVRHRGSSRSLAAGGLSYGTTTPDPTGAWSLTDVVGFDDGYADADATCGDPFAEGFQYDPQVVIVKSLPVDPPPPTTTPATTPATTVPVVPSPPAAAIPGNATFAG